MKKQEIVEMMKVIRAGLRPNKFTPKELAVALGELERPIKNTSKRKESGYAL